jgi:PKD repeat protein
MNGFPDYMKFGVWRDGYYMSANSSGNDIYVFERTAMLAGNPAPAMVGFNNPNRPNSGFHCIQPLDNDGQFAPVGTPGLFITINDDSWGGSDQLWMFELDVDWNTPSNSTFTRTQMIDVAAFDSQFNSWGVGDIVQPGTSQKLDAIPMILMYRAQYRNFGSSENIVVCHTVDVNSTNWAGIRWYELEKAGSSWTVRQQGTYAPDSDNRWMGSITMNGNHEIGLAYSVSSSSTYPSIRYTGQSLPENMSASGVLDYTEVSILEGTNRQTVSNRWGDYSLLSVDPDDDHTFWFTTEYIGNGGAARKTKIASFEFAPPPLTANFQAYPVSGYAALTVDFTDLSSGEIDTWLWDFGDGNTSTSRNPTHTYPYVGLYSVSLTIANDTENNTRIIEDYIEVIQPPDPPISDFTADVTVGTEPLTVNFIDLSSNDPLTWFWEFGEGSTSTIRNPSFTYYYPGIYDVALTTTSQGGSSDTEIKEAFIEVTASVPQPDFNGTPTSGVIPLQVSFNDLSEGTIESWLWDFGDGNTSYEQNPEYIYSESGIFSVSLTVTGPGGTESIIKEAYISIFDPMSIEVSAMPEEICDAEISQLHVEVSGGLGENLFSWTSDPEGFISDEQSPQVSPDKTTIYMVEVTDGEQIINGDIQITVFPLPEIELVDWPEILCNQQEPPIQLQANPQGGIFSGDYVTPEGIFSPEEAELGWNVIAYTYQDDNNCEATARDSIYIDNCVSISKFNGKEVSVEIYPNPNSGLFTVKCNLVIERLEVVDQSGKILYNRLVNSRSDKISLNLSEGLYIVRSYVINEKGIKKLLISDIIIH